ncbi:MAG: divergent polysaccharide deacetylase family protein [Caulobacterales bacterium]|nr:divergent polysaccharide deacetylase family protein [Caulobacterales bacterium]
MFARRQSALASSAGTPPAPRMRLNARALLAQLKKPPVAVSAAALAFIGAASLLVIAIGDPRAGTPTARADVERPAPVPRPQISGAEVFGVDTLGAYQDLTAPGDVDAPGGEAVITLPGSAQVLTGPVVRQAPAAPLPAAPIAGLSQPGPNGPLPVIASDGRTAFSAYARPFTADGRPRVALIVGGLGLNAPATRAAIEALPAEVTLSFSAYAEGLQGWIDLARADGHEVLLELPMEPEDYPQNDTGPYTLLAGSDIDELDRRMNWLLGRATGYYGVSNYLGTAFFASDVSASPFMQRLRSRGLAFIDDGQARNRQGAYARASANRVIDEAQDAASILAALNGLEASARANGQALGTGYGFAVTVATAVRWTQGLNERGIQLAPASALAARSGVRRAS